MLYFREIKTGGAARQSYDSSRRRQTGHFAKPAMARCEEAGRELAEAVKLRP